MKAFILALATGLGAGYSPRAPGTVGTLAAVLLYLPFARFNQSGDPGKFAVYLSVVAILCVVGTWVSGRAEKLLGEKDCQKIVIDEIAGYFITMSLLPAGWAWIAAGFVMFRLFDITKPPPIRNLQSIGGGAGVMIDDVLAGLLACGSLHLVNFIL